ncbi:pyridoxamine 5'-phosphate oxidase family protein [Patescibacteria group bacterium]
MESNDNLRAKALKFLRDERIMFFATASPDGEPHVAAMLFAVDDNFTFTFVTREDTAKAKNLAGNPRGALSVGGWHGDMNVQAWGPVEQIAEAEEARSAMARIADVNSGLEGFWPPLLRIDAGGYAVFRLRPDRVRALDLTSRHVNEAEPPFTELIA